MQIFGGPTTVTINATATAIVGNQRQTPALLTLSSNSCALVLTGAAELTVLGDVYTNGSACIDSNLHEAGNCYGGAGSNCNVAQYFCYNSTPGFVPYPPPCLPGDIQGTAVVPAPTLLLTSISPPWASMIPYDTANPRPTPLPSLLVVKNGSKILLRFSGGMPSPLSAT